LFQPSITIKTINPSNDNIEDKSVNKYGDEDSESEADATDEAVIVDVGIDDTDRVQVSNR
jgi:hypothetical protein